MSQDVASIPFEPAVPAKPLPRSFVAHAKLIGFITFISRLLGMARESVAANYFGAGAIYAAFTFAFTIPNLFRKLLGEGALSAAFIPLYAQAIKREQNAIAHREEASCPETATTAAGGLASSRGPSGDILSANDFAAASVNLLCTILLVLTLVGELLLVGVVYLVPMRPDYLLAAKLTMIMLPYVLMVCGQAFLGSILQVHHRFIATTLTSVLLNLCLIIAMVLASVFFDLHTEAGRDSAVRWLSASVLVAGVIQITMLLPSLR
ncbi:MAG: lipid II flippase MurJ, partial [Tepidisphaeraceae bacterium]